MERDFARARRRKEDERIQQCPRWPFRPASAGAGKPGYSGIGSEYLSQLALSTISDTNLLERRHVSNQLSLIVCRLKADSAVVLSGGYLHMPGPEFASLAPRKGLVGKRPRFRLDRLDLHKRSRTRCPESDSFDHRETRENAERPPGAIAGLKRECLALDPAAWIRCGSSSLVVPVGN